MFVSNEYKDVITRLKFVSKIQPGEKINTKHYLSIVTNDWLTALLRTFYNFDSRAQSVAFISDTINMAFGMIEKVKAAGDGDELHPQTDGLQNLFKDLAQTKVGITNLIKTYKTDKIIVCQLETVIENIDLFLLVNNVDI